MGLLGRVLDVKQAYIQISQSLRCFDSGVLKSFQQGEDVADSSQVHAVLARERLDGLELQNIPARIPPPVGDSPLGADHVQVLVHHQRPRVRLEDLRGHAEREDRLVEVDTGITPGWAAGGCGRIPGF